MNKVKEQNPYSERTATIPIAIDNIDEQLTLLNDAEPRTRLRAIGVLRRLANSKAIEPLCQTLLSDEVPDVRARAASALGQMGDPAAIAALSRALDDSTAEVRRRAAQALYQISDAAAIDPLIKALSDSDRDVRRLAARTLGEIGNATTLEALKQLHNDPNPVVQDEAAQAIRCVQDRRSLQTQRDKVEQLREQRSRIINSTLDQVQLDSQIDMEQLAIYRLEASLAANKVALPVDEEATTADHEKQSLIYQLRRLIRELESLSTSMRAVRLREAWENQLREATELLEIWNAGNELSQQDMQTELKRLVQQKENRFDTQNFELIELTRFVQEGYSCQLQMEQIYGVLKDPTNRAKVETWRHAAEAEYKFLRSTRDQGDYVTAKEHHSNLVELRERIEALKELEDKAKIKTGKAVILFILFSILALTLILYILNWLGLADAKVPALGIPYAVISWSVIGSIAAMLYQFLNQPVSELETYKWLVARPIQGIIMGSFLYLIVAGGLVILANQTDLNIRPEMAAAIGFLGGFSDRFAEVMVKRATSILSQEQADQQHKPYTP